MKSIDGFRASTQPHHHNETHHQDDHYHDEKNEHEDDHDHKAWEHFDGKEHEHTEKTEHTHHAHEPLHVDDLESIPSVELRGYVDASSGVNLELVTQNFTFTPEHVNLDNVDNQWHAHVYVNREKKSRVYGNWFYLSTKELNNGEYEISVDLNGTDHSPFYYQGGVISDSVTLTITEGKSILSFEH